jgi:photosystem II stability/assembly factor-like uncharacterized protein
MYQHFDQELVDKWEGHFMNNIHNRARVQFIIITVVILVLGLVLWAGTSVQASVDEFPVGTSAAFAPIGHFETRFVPYNTRLAVAPNAEIFLYSQSFVYRSKTEGYLWESLPLFEYRATKSALAVSPNYMADQTIFLGLKLGFNALLISSDGGKNWELPVDQVIGPVLYIAVSPNFADDQTIYIGTRTYNGPYIYRSVDGGQHWEGLSFPDPSGVTKIQFSPNYSLDRTIFFMTETGDLLSLTESGHLNFPASQVNQRPDAVIIKDFAISPNFTVDSTIFISTDVGQFVSYDAGQSWKYQNGIELLPLTISPDYAASRAIYGGADNGLMRSTNDGMDWENVLACDTVYDMDFSLNYLVDRTIYALVYDGFYVSHDGGSSWQRVSQRFFATEYGLEEIQLSPNFSNDNILFIGPSPGYIGGVYRSDDGGMSLQALPLPETGGPIFALAGTFTTYQTVFLAFEKHLWISTDGGYNWTSLPDLPVYKVQSIRASPNFSVDQTLFIASHGEGVFRSKDGGKSWQNVTGSMSYSLSALEISPSFAEDQTLFGVSDAIYRSDDGGDTWSQVGEPASTSGWVVRMSPTYAQDRTVFVAHSGSSSGGVYRSIDQGETWVELGETTFTALTPTLAISPMFADDQTLIAGDIDGPLFISEDAGENWFPMVGISSDPDGLMRKYGAVIGYQGGRNIPIASASDGVFRYIWHEHEYLEMNPVYAFYEQGDPEQFTKGLKLAIDGTDSPGFVLQEPANWLETQPISGTLPVNVELTFDASGLVDRLKTTVSLDVYWSQHDVDHYYFPVYLISLEDRHYLPLVQN